MTHLIGPPPVEEVPAAELFRTLVRAPRPWVPTNVVPGGRVFAISGSERSEIEARVSHLPTAARGIATLRHELAIALHDESGPVFGSADAVREVPETTVRQMRVALQDAWNRCAPDYSGRFDVAAWGVALEKGAEANPNVTLTLGASLDVQTQHVVERPDWWFSVPLRDLTDGQWMAFRAAARVASRWNRRD